MSESVKKERKRRSAVWLEMTNEQFAALVKKSCNIGEVLRAFGLENIGGNARTAKERIARLGIDATHLSSQKSITRKPRPLDKVLVVGSTTSRPSIKKRVIRAGLLIEKCQICGLDPHWNGTRLVLVLDHINGKSDDNRIENLRLLCPNCNSQTSTFAGKNNGVKKPYNKCLDCARKIGRKARHCLSCSSKHKDYLMVGRSPKIVWPTLEELREEIVLSSWEAVADRLKVSSNAIRRHIKRRDPLFENPKTRKNNSFKNAPLSANGSAASL